MERKKRVMDGEEIDAEMDNTMLMALGAVIVVLAIPLFGWLAHLHQAVQ